MRHILAHSISAIISNIGLIASAEPDSEKRKVLIRELAEGAIAGIEECKETMNSYLYDGEIAELDSTVYILKKSYFKKTD